MEPTKSGILGVLGAGEWFRSLPEDLRRMLVERAQVARLRRGEHLITEGQPPSGLFAVIAGDVHVTRRSGANAEALLHVAGPGFWMGETAVLLRCEHVVSVVAQTDVTAVALGPETLADLVLERPDFRLRLADLIDARHMDEPGAGYDVCIPQSELAALIGVSRQTLSDLLKRLEARGILDVAYRRITIRDPKRLRGDRPRTEIFRPHDGD